MAKEKVKIREGLKVTPEKKKQLAKKPGSSNVGKYKSLSKDQFAGRAGGAAPGTYPINTKARAKSALKLAHNAPNPEGIKRKVYSKYPELRPEKKNGKR